MGIDVYMRWKDQTEDEQQAQITGFSTEHGHVGYLREAYHGEPYATAVLVPEAFTADVPIKASLLRDRLPDTLRAAETRERTLYHGDDAGVKRVQQSFIDFVDLAERKERETGEPVTIVVSA